MQRQRPSTHRLHAVRTEYTTAPVLFTSGNYHSTKAKRTLCKQMLLTPEGSLQPSKLRLLRNLGGNGAIILLEMAIRQTQIKPPFCATVDCYHNKIVLKNMTTAGRMSFRIASAVTEEDKPDSEENDAGRSTSWWCLDTLWISAERKTSAYRQAGAWTRLCLFTLDRSNRCGSD